MPPPLSGIRIIDLGWIIAGPLATRLLADFGAEVIKVESAERIDVARGNREPLYGVLPGDANTNPDTGGYFHDANAGKCSCTLNLAGDDGRRILRQLVQISDAIVCNLGGDQLDRWGIGYERALELNPGIIVVNMPTMESHGPRARWRAFGDMIAGAAGLKSVSGQSEDPPLPFGHQYPDFSANPRHAALALVAALYHRDRTGEGQFIEVSQYESTIALLGPSILEFTANGHVPTRPGNRDPDAVPHNLYRCRGEESWCAISIFTDQQWQALISTDALGSLRRPELATLAGRRRCEAEIDDAVESWTIIWDRQELAAFLQARGIPAGPLQSIAEIVEVDPVLGDRYFTRIAHPAGREFLVHGNPVQLWGNPADVRRAPMLGEHTADVLGELLGMSRDEIAEYAARGAIA
ncbi:MAG: CaiB/BaiF CoA transferase family protein [Dehalococcoidia bacterium]